MSRSFSKEFFLKKFQTISIESSTQTQQSDPSVCNFMEFLQNYPEIFSKPSLDPESFKKFFLNPDDAIANSPTYPPKFQNKKGFSNENLKKPKTFSTKKDYFSCLSSPFEKILRSALKRKEVNLLEKIWFSEDSNGINGPFSTQEMDSLFKEEKLARNLKVAFGRKEKFSYINKLYERFCGDIPLKEDYKEEKEEKIGVVNKPTRFDVLLDYDKKSNVKEEEKSNTNEALARNEAKIERNPIMKTENKEIIQEPQPKTHDNLDNSGNISGKLTTEIKENNDIIVTNETEIKKAAIEFVKKSEKTHEYNKDSSTIPKTTEKEIIIDDKPKENKEVPHENTSVKENLAQQQQEAKEEENSNKQVSKKKKNKKKKGNIIDITELIPEIKPAENKPAPLQETPVKEAEKPANYQMKEEDFPGLPMNPATKAQSIIDDKDFIKVKKPSKNDKSKKSQEITEVPVKATLQKKKSEPQINENPIEKPITKEKEEVKAVEKPKTQEKQINEMDFPSLEESKNSKVISQKNKPLVIVQEPKKKKNLNGEWDFDDEPRKKSDKKDPKKEGLLINDENFPSLM